VEPRATSAEEPDGGNLLVRIWRGAGTGNLPAYSTTAFSTDRVPPPHATLLPSCPLLPSAGCRRQAAGSQRTDRMGGWGRAACTAGAARGEAARGGHII